MYYTRGAGTYVDKPQCVVTCIACTMSGDLNTQCPQFTWCRGCSDSNSYAAVTSKSCFGIRGKKSIIRVWNETTKAYETRKVDGALIVKEWQTRASEAYNDPSRVTVWVCRPSPGDPSACSFEEPGSSGRIYCKWCVEERKSIPR